MTEVDTEWRNSHQRTEKEEYQKKPHRASFFEFHVQEKRGSSASSFSLHLITDSPSEKLAPMGLCQFPVRSREGITSRTAALDWPQECSQAAAWANHRAREGKATTGRSRLKRKHPLPFALQKSVIAVSDGWLREHHAKGERSFGDALPFAQESPRASNQTKHQRGRECSANAVALHGIRSTK